MPGEALARLHGLAGSERASKQTDLLRLLHQSTGPGRFCLMTQQCIG
jgi:hypothetical protein